MSREVTAGVITTGIMIALGTIVWLFIVAPAVMLGILTGALIGLAVVVIFSVVGAIVYETLPEKSKAKDTQETDF